MYVASDTSPAHECGLIGLAEVARTIRGGPFFLKVMLSESVAGEPLLPMKRLPGSAVWSTIAAFFSETVTVPSSVVFTASSGTLTIQKRPLGRIPPLKSCTCVCRGPELGSHKSIHINTKVPWALVGVKVEVAPT